MCRPYRLSAFAALILTLNGSGFAQQYSFRHYGAADGLQNLAILSLAQDGAGYIWAGSEGGLYRYDGTRFGLMAATEGLPCVTEVHALHVASDGALWVNTCAQIFRFDGQRFHPIAGVSGMLSGAQRMANNEHGNVLVATPSGMYEAAPNGAGSYSAHPYPLGPEFAGMSIRELPGTGPRLWFAGGGGHSWENGDACRRSVPRKDCLRTTGTRLASGRMVPCGSAARASCTGSRPEQRDRWRRNRISHPAPSGAP